MTMTIAQHAATAAAALREMAPDARARTLTGADIERAIRLHLAACKKLKGFPKAHIETTKFGGYVQKKSRRASCDCVKITGHRARDLSVQTTREAAKASDIGRTLLVRMYGWRNYGPLATRGTVIRSE